ncbi:MAG: DUF3471 domain-containing protein [Opitutaceae bacterium]
MIAVVLHQNGQTPRGVREPLPSPIERKEITLPEETLNEYAGTYIAQPGLEFSVTQEKGSLLVQLTGQERAPVFATAKDEFFYKIVDAQLSFKRDEAGRVIGLVLHQSGRELNAKKR